MSEHYLSRRPAPYPDAMTANPLPALTPEQENVYLRRLILGLMTTLESRGVLTATDLNVIIGAAQQTARQHVTTPAPQAKAAEAKPKRSTTRKKTEPVPVIDLNMD